LLTKEVKAFLVEYSKEKTIPLYVDARRNHTDYIGATVFKLNKKELNTLMLENNLHTKAEVCEFLNTELLIETKGGAGAEYYLRDRESYFMPEFNYRSSLQKPEMPDVTGCGDVFDISFVKYFYHDKMNLVEAFTKTVDDATRYAYMPVGERL
jgi:bifunctional ADP-heptose synthase (sugar kinase/adenylyltransferase)